MSAFPITFLGFLLNEGTLRKMPTSLDITTSEEAVS